MPSPRAQLEALNARIIACDRCPRLREYCANIAKVRRRA
jgi:uracil-DNA glycosylase